jgi:ribose 5-phosphate isomerase B
MARWVIANDHAGLLLKDIALATIRALGHELIDLGTNSTDPVDYPDFAHALAAKIAAGEAARGVLICGSGIGVSIAANRHKGVRAALCSEPLSATLARQHNDANVLCMGARLIGPAVAEAMIRAFDATAYEGGRHQRRVEKLDA